MRNDEKAADTQREVRLTPHVLIYAEGSAEIVVGKTRLICSASVEPTLPKWLAGTGQGWITAEYGMLPRSTHTRIHREKAASGGRTQEISRLIGRALRAAVDLRALGERQITVDCDVIEADGGTRTAAITGGFVALALALDFLRSQKQIATLPIHHYVAAISVGIVQDRPRLDLNYEEDSLCSTDMNVVMNSASEFIEIQGTAEKKPFSSEELASMLELAKLGCQNLFRKQYEVLKGLLPLNNT